LQQPILTVDDGA